MHWGADKFSYIRVYSSRPILALRIDATLPYRSVESSRYQKTFYYSLHLAVYVRVGTCLMEIFWVCADVLISQGLYLAGNFLVVTGYPLWMRSMLGYRGVN